MGEWNMSLIYSNELPWMKINDFLLSSEHIRDPKEFCSQVVKNIYPLIPYDQARVYFLDYNGKVYDHELTGVDKRWNDIYLDYYSKIDNGQYSIFSRIENKCHVMTEILDNVHDWENKPSDEFIKEYIKPQGLSYSMGFGLHNDESLTVTSCSLDRTKHQKFTLTEMSILGILLPHLNNMYKNLLALQSANKDNKNTEVSLPLTKREKEIAELLRKGMTPSNISKKLFLSLPTIYKHIANIHEKLNVSNRQELLLKLVN